MSSEVVWLDTFRPDVVEAVLGEVAMTREMLEQLEAQYEASVRTEGRTARATESSQNATLQLLYARMAAWTLGLPYVK
jgi:hypothetical protein